MGEPDRAGRAARRVVETHAGVFEATATPGLYAAADIDDDDAARAYVDVQVVLTRTEAAEVRALQRRAAMSRRGATRRHSAVDADASRRGPSYRPEAKGLRGGTSQSVLLLILAWRNPTTCKNRACKL